MWLTGGQDRRPPVAVDQMALREEMTRDDPDMARARRVLHEASEILTIERNRDRYEAERQRRGLPPRG